MGTFAGFEEKEFETLANASFVLRSRTKKNAQPALFSPGQVLERDLGFDFSIYLDPASPTFRLLFGGFPGLVAPRTTRTPKLPPGTPNVNAFIQYKRPEYFTENHRQPVWRGEPFLRFSVRSRYTLHGQLYDDHSQLDTLARLANDNPGAMVRYACPSVWTRTDLYAQYARDDLIANCAFTDPRNLLRRRGGERAMWHDYWTFQPRKPNLGRPNPDGPMRGAQTGQDFLKEVRSALADPHGHAFTENVFEIRSTARRSRKDLDFFKSRSSIHGLTKGRAIEEVIRSTRADFLSAPRDENWLLQVPRLDAQRPSRRPRSNEMEIVEAVVEVAATARELGLTWMTAVG